MISQSIGSTSRCRWPEPGRYPLGVSVMADRLSLAGVGVRRASRHAAVVIRLRTGDRGERVDQAEFAVDVAESMRVRSTVRPPEPAIDVDHAHLLVDQVITIDDVEHARRHADFAARG